MPIDPSVAVGAHIRDHSFTWDFSDVLLYHLGLGAGADPMDAQELTYVYEEHLQVLPTFATVAPDLRKVEPPSIVYPGVDVDLQKVVLGTQELTVHRPLPTSGTARAVERVVDVYDKGSGALILVETDVADEAGDPLWTSVMHIFAKGEGGFGGQRGVVRRVAVPSRAPDVVKESQTLPQQALIFRLCGDRNPLHADPAFARVAGYDRPILHGLGIYGVVAKAVVDGALDGKADLVHTWTALCSAPVFPGETLRTSMWIEDSGQILVESRSVERDEVVLTNAVLTTR